MLAGKWLGNTGAHEDGALTAAVVLEGVRLCPAAQRSAPPALRVSSHHCCGRRYQCDRGPVNVKNS